MSGRDLLLLYAAGLQDVIETAGKPVRLGWWIIGKMKQPWIKTIWLPEPLPAVARPIKTATIVASGSRGLRGSYMVETPARMIFLVPDSVLSPPAAT